MAQIIKHRRGSIDSLKGSLARKGELVIATGSIGNMNGPWVFVGDNDSAGAYKPTSQIYRGNTAPTISNLTYGSTLDGTPFYSITSKSLFILDSTGNAELDLTGNIEGNTISGVTINNLQSTNVTASFVSGAFIGDASGLYNIPATGVTGLNLSKIYSGSVQVSTDSVSSTITLSGGTINMNNDVYIETDAHLYHNGVFIIEDNANGVTLNSTNYAQLQSSNAWVWVEGDSAYLNGGTYTQIFTDSGNVDINAYNGGTLNLNNDGGEGDVYVLNNSNDLYISSNAGDWSFKKEGDIVFPVISTNGRTGNGEGIQFKKSNNQKVITTEAGTSGSNTVERMVIAGGDSYFDGSTYQGEGGDLYLWAGKGNNGGDIKVDAGEGVNGQGGTVKMRAGYSLNADGGFVEITAGNSGNATGGNVEIYAGNGVTDGTVNIHSVTNILGGQFVLDNDKLQLGGGVFEVDTATGDIRTTGSITMKGNITIGDSLSGDTINLNAEISSSLIPSGSGIFNLGSDTNQWGNLFVSGTAHIGTLNLGSIELNSLSLPGDLTVSGTTKFSGSVSVSGLTDGRVVYVGTNGQLVDNGGLSFDGTNLNVSGALETTVIQGTGSLYLYPDKNDSRNIEIYNTSPNDVHIKGNSGLTYFGDDTNYLLINTDNSTATLNSSNTLYLQSQNSSVNVNSYDGNLNLNTDSNNNISIGGNTYLDNNKELFVSYIRDNNNNWNYLQLYGYGTDDGYWWESGNGNDTSLINNDGNGNIAIINTNNGKVNIDATNGSVNIHSTDGTNITGSLTVSDGSGFFNSYLIANNSDLTLEGGSNIHMNDAAHLYFDTCVDIYYDNGTQDLIFYNDCNAFQFRNSVSITGSLNVSNDLYIDNIYGRSNSNNVLRFNGGSFGAPQIELASSGQISLFSEGGGTDYAINMTGSVNLADSLGVTGSANFRNDVNLNNGNTLYTNNIYGYGDGELNIAANSGLYLWSDTTRYVEIATDNDESGTNYLITDSTGIKLQTYDFTSDLTHIVKLDNLGNLDITNVNVHISGSLGVDGNTIYNNDLTVGGNMYVSGNFTVLGTGSIITLSGSQVDIGTNKILLNTYAPFERFAGIDVYDSGSNAGVTGSLLWDSLNNVWIYANPSGSSYASARFISGPKNTGSLGEEAGLTNGHIPIATGDDHISDSLLTYIGTTLALNSNKFTVDSDSGDTLILGNFTIQGTGGDDNGNESSFLVFRNSDNVLGFVDSTDTTSETSQLMGYETSTGNLVFSSLIDGGTY